MLTLTKGTSGHLDTVSDAELGVARGDRVDLAEALEVVHAQLVAEEVEHNVLERAGVSVGEDKPVAVVPLRVLGVGLEEARPQNVGGRGHAHRRTGVARVGLERDGMRQRGLFAQKTGSRAHLENDISGKSADGAEREGGKAPSA